MSKHNDKILVQNIYHMLAYAYRELQVERYTTCGSEDFENTAELLAAILHLGVSLQIKRGLGRSYIEHTSPLSCLSGKIELSETLKHQTLLRHQLVCTYDEFSIDTKMNRVLKSTMELLLKADIRPQCKTDLRKSLLYFKDVGSLDVTKVDWHFNFNRNNQSYQMLMAICHMVVKNLLLTTEAGLNNFRKFFDEQQMSRLYEKFLLGFYSRHYPQLNARAAQISWVLDDGNTFLLPKMKTDVTLSYQDHTLIIDAKYYQNPLSHHQDATTLRSNHLYQIFAYVKNMAASSSKVSGMLLYAQPHDSQELNQSYMMQGNQISVQTIDLNRDFKEISDQLEGIAREHFGVEKQR